MLFMIRSKSKHSDFRLRVTTADDSVSDSDLYNEIPTYQNEKNYNVNSSTNHHSLSQKNKTNSNHMKPSTNLNTVVNLDDVPFYGSRNHNEMLYDNSDTSIDNSTPPALLQNVMGTLATKGNQSHSQLRHHKKQQFMNQKNVEEFNESVFNDQMGFNQVIESPNNNKHFIDESTKIIHQRLTNNKIKSRQNEEKSKAFYQGWQNKNGGWVADFGHPQTYSVPHTNYYSNTYVDDNIHPPNYHESSTSTTFNKKSTIQNDLPNNFTYSGVTKNISRHVFDIDDGHLNKVINSKSSLFINNHSNDNRSQNINSNLVFENNIFRIPTMLATTVATRHYSSGGMEKNEDGNEYVYPTSSLL